MVGSGWWSRAGRTNGVWHVLALAFAAASPVHAQAPAEAPAPPAVAPPPVVPPPQVVAPPADMAPPPPSGTPAPLVPAAPPPAAPLPPPDSAVPPVEPAGPVYPEPPPDPGSAPLPPEYYGRYGGDGGSLEVNALQRGAREHEGFFLRLTVGVGAVLDSYREAVDGYEESSVTTRALAGLFSASVGGRVVANLIVHGDLMASSFGDADRQIDGTTDARDRIDGSLAVLGGGATYYFMPVNAYLTGVLGAARFSERRDGEDAIQSGTGVGVALLIGKEWWVGRSGEWGMGGALRSMFVSAPLDIAGTESRLSAVDIGIVFGTTYN